MKLHIDSLLANGDFTDFEADALRAAFTNRGLSADEKKRGIVKLRKAKPFRKVESFESGCANYVHRWICFDMGTNDHMPCTDIFELLDGLEARDGKLDRNDSAGRSARFDDMRKLGDSLRETVTRFMRFIPIEHQAGIMRWGRALGMIG